MRLTEKPMGTPGFCCITGTSTDEEGFIDTGNEISFYDPRIVVSMKGLRQLVEFVGWPTNVEFHEEAKRADALQKENDLLREQLNKASNALDAIHVIEGRGFKPKKKTGPKPKELV